MDKNRGFTLIEIMISLLIGLIVVGATISVYITTVGSSSSTIKSTRLNHDLESVMTLMINDIKRAGYWNGARLGADSRNNPFTSATTNLTISGTDTIVYSYDADEDGVVDTNECYGFRFSNNGIQIRTAVTDVGNCNGTAGTWEEFVDTNQLNIIATGTTKSEFSLTPITGLTATSRCLNHTTDTVTNAAACATVNTGDNIIQNRIVNIRLVGQVKNDTPTKTLSASVEVRNNRLYTAP